MDIQLTEPQQKQLDELLYGRQKIQAIKLYREWTRVGLKEAKDAVEMRQASLRTLSPESFPAKGGGCMSVMVLAGGAVAAWVWACGKI